MSVIFDFIIDTESLNDLANTLFFKQFEWKVGSSKLKVKSIEKMNLFKNSERSKRV